MKKTSLLVFSDKRHLERFKYLNPEFRESFLIPILELRFDAFPNYGEPYFIKRKSRIQSYLSLFIQFLIDQVYFSQDSKQEWTINRHRYRYAAQINRIVRKRRFFILRILSRIELKISPQSELSGMSDQEIFEVQNVILCPFSWRKGENQASLAKWAHRHHKSLVYLPWGWDNPTMKSWVRPYFDKAILHSDWQRNEIRISHEFKGQILLASPFNLQALKNYSTSAKKENFEKIQIAKYFNVSTNSIWITICGGQNLEISNKTQEMFDFVITLIESLELKNERYTIFLKPYPVQQEIDRFKKLAMRSNSNLRIILASSVLDSKEFGRYEGLEFWRVVAHSDICFSGNTTFLLEATILGTPTYTWETRDQISTETQHFSLAFKHDLLNFISSKELRNIQNLLLENSLKAQGAYDFLGLNNPTILELAI